jgi:hypothetical protein
MSGCRGCDATSDGFSPTEAFLVGLLLGHTGANAEDLGLCASCRGQFAAIGQSALEVATEQEKASK